jgi:hypothetical protein
MKSLFAKARGSTFLALSLLMALFFINVEIVKASSLPAAVAASNAQVLHEDPGRDVVTASNSIEIRPTANFQAECLEHPAKFADGKTTEWSMPLISVLCTPSASRFPLLSHENGKYVFYSNLSPVATAETNLSPVSSPWSLQSEGVARKKMQQSSFG